MIVCDAHRKHSATGVLLHVSCDRGGYFGRVTNMKVRTGVYMKMSRPDPGNVDFGRETTQILI